MTEFEQKIHNMFDHIWDCEIEHPFFQDTVGELMQAVIQCYQNLPHWIPVSERLPEDEGWYLVTDDSGGVRWLNVEYYDPEIRLEPFYTIQNPVAWMPLPEPYKAGESE